MGEITDGHAATGPRAPDEDDPDSSVRSSFFARLFRREPTDPSQSDLPAAGKAARELRVNLRKLRNLRIDDVSIPRADIVAVPVSAGLDEVVAVFRTSTLTRLPVYAETLDEPLGIVHLKDLALGYGFGADGGDFDLQGLLRPLLYAPPSMPLGVLLQKMQTAHVHMALVIDEYGGVDGLVTFEDLLEQIVGEIADEHDEAEGASFVEEEPAVYLIEGRTDLDDFAAATGIQLVDAALADEVDTVGGLVFRLAGRVPVRGEVVVDPAGHTYEVVEADARKVQRVRVRMHPDEAASSEAAE